MVPKSYISFYLPTSRNGELTARQEPPRQSNLRFPLIELDLMTQPIEDILLGQDSEKNLQIERSLPVDHG